jgi:hemerythrin
MNKIEWSDKFSVGISLLDEQHKRLIDMINRLIEFHNIASLSENIIETLRSMSMYALTHFEYEEKIMIDYSYPDYTSHKEQHEEFKKKVASFYSATPISVDVLNANVVEYLKSWLIYHILKEDMKYKRFYNEKGLLDKVTSMV